MKRKVVTGVADMDKEGVGLKCYCHSSEALMCLEDRGQKELKSFPLLAHLEPSDIVSVTHYVIQIQKNVS